MKIKLNSAILKNFMFVLSIVFLTSCQEDNFSSDSETTSTLGKRNPKSQQLVVENGTYHIINRFSQKAIDVSGSSIDNGANIQQSSLTEADNQKFTITSLSDGYYQIEGFQSTKSLDIANSSTLDGGNLHQWTYWGSNNQQWKFNDLGNGYYTIENRNSLKVLEVAGGSDADGANVQQSSYWGGESQQWSLVTPTPTQEETEDYQGQLSWRLTTKNVPKNIKTRIIAAMDDAVARYNKGASWAPRTLNVSYLSTLPTADGNPNGSIRFGPNEHSTNVRTAMHEIAHTYGVGYEGFNNNTDANGNFTGTNTLAVLATFDGPDATIGTGGGHFWPYGMNWNSEWSEVNAYRHVKIISAMVADGI